MEKGKNNHFWFGLVIVTLSLVIICQQIAFCTPPEWRHPGYGPSKITLSKEPKLGEVIALTYTITPKADIPHARIKFSCNEGIEFVSAKDNVEILSRKLARVYYSASKNKSNSFTIHVKFISNSGSISVTANEDGKDKEGKEQVGLWFGKAYLDRVLVDPATGRLGITGEYYSGIIHRYDPAAGEFLKGPDPGVGKLTAA